MPEPALPRGKVFWRALGLLVFVVASYNIGGTVLRPWLESRGRAFCTWQFGSICELNTDGFFAGRIALETRLYWLPGIFSLIGLSIFVFPSPLGRKVLATAGSVLTVIVLWAIQVLGGITLAAHGFYWGSELVSGPFAVLASVLTFIVGFVVLISGLLAGRGQLTVGPGQP